MPDLPPKSELARIAEIFHRHGVEFIVIGGQAASIYGSPLVTYDVDLCYRRSPENIRRLAEALREMSPKLRGLPEGLPNNVDERMLRNGSNFTFETSIIDLDLLAEVEPIGGYEALSKNAITARSHGIPLLTIGLDDLLRVKLHINRPKDQESILQLKAIKRIREETRE